MLVTRDGTTPTSMGQNPRVILGRPAPPRKLERGLQGRTRDLAMWSREGDGTPSDGGEHGTWDLTRRSWGDHETSTFEVISGQQHRRRVA